MTDERTMPNRKGVDTRKRPEQKSKPQEAKRSPDKAGARPIAELNQRRQKADHR